MTKSCTWWRGPPRNSDRLHGNHYCVSVVDLDAAIAELEALGIDYQRAVQGKNTVQIWISDPAGNTIELQQDTRGRVTNRLGTSMTSVEEITP